MAILTLLYDMIEDSLVDYDARKNFCERTVKRFEAFHKKIRNYERIDYRKSVLNFVCHLNKRTYHIPQIQIPPTLSFDDPEEEESEEEGTSSSEGESSSEDESSDS